MDSGVWKQRVQTPSAHPIDVQSISTSHRTDPVGENPRPVSC